MGIVCVVLKQKEACNFQIAQKFTIFEEIICFHHRRK